MLSGSDDGTIKIWNIVTYSEECSLQSGLRRVYCGCRIPSTSRVAIGGWFLSDIKILDINTRQYV